MKFIHQARIGPNRSIWIIRRGVYLSACNELYVLADQVLRNFRGRPRRHTVWRWQDLLSLPRL